MNRLLLNATYYWAGWFVGYLTGLRRGGISGRE